MEPVNEALRLLKRSEEITEAIDRRGTMSISEEQELFAIRERLQRFPAALHAIERAAQALRRPVGRLNAADVHQIEGGQAA